jgi:hypothetical protein
LKAPGDTPGRLREDARATQRCVDMLGDDVEYIRALNRYYFAAFNIGITLPVGALLLGHGIAWAMRGLRVRS